ncbi:ferredoxin [Spirochaetia bacterium]|nr:ferredoxin [Spirochaetia bacterium]
MTIILITAIFALLLAFILGLALGFFREFFAVEQDPLIGQIREALPGANCGACGFPGCDGYASALASATADASGRIEINRCSVGGQPVADKLAALTGNISSSVVPIISVLACRGAKDKAPLKGEYSGIPTCRGAKLSTGGTKLCAWGCLGFGDCVKVCAFGAISMGEDGLPKIDKSLCTGCKRCVAECPQLVLQVVPRGRTGAIPLCSNRNPIKANVLKTCKAGCIKCELCVKNCPENCITLEKGIPVIDYTKCTSCGTCAAKCPTKVLSVLG